MTIHMILILSMVSGITSIEDAKNINATTPSAEVVHQDNENEAKPEVEPAETDVNDAAQALWRLQEGGLSRQSKADVLWPALLETYAELLSVRRSLAKVELASSALQKELDELKQFIVEHDTYGPDFKSYTKMVEETRKQRRADAIREKREQDAARRKTREEARQRLDATRKLNDLERLYDERGFGPIGQDVYTSRSAFFYGPRDGEDGKEIQYKPTRYGGFKAVTIPSNRELDYSEMTISGSLLNGSADIRSIGIAITFFDEHGNQVGAEIIEIENARPNVPYPFTRKVDMALNRPFSSHASYVLYADQVDIP